MLQEVRAVRVGRRGEKRPFLGQGIGGGAIEGWSYGVVLRETAVFGGDVRWENGRFAVFLIRFDSYGHFQ